MADVNLDRLSLSLRNSTHSACATNAERDELLALIQYARRLEAALGCEHTRCGDDGTADRLWEFVEHQGETWHRCRQCGTLELWAAGLLVCTTLSGLDGDRANERSAG